MRRSFIILPIQTFFKFFFKCSIFIFKIFNIFENWHSWWCPDFIIISLFLKIFSFENWHSLWCPDFIIISLYFKIFSFENWHSWWFPDFFITSLFLKITVLKIGTRGGAQISLLLRCSLKFS